jgi:hypothetical protein
MKTMFEGLDTETQLLVGIGAAVAAGCIPCLENFVSLAENAAIDNKRLKTAAIIGQFVKNQPVMHMQTASDRMLGTHLKANAQALTCPIEAPQKKVSPCGCNPQANKASAGC